MNKAIQKGFFLMLAFFSAIVTWAQEKKLDVDVDVNTKQSNWYTQPWVWVVGAAIFILLLVAILKGNSKRD